MISGREETRIESRPISARTIGIILLNAVLTFLKQRVSQRFIIAVGQDQEKSAANGLELGPEFFCFSTHAI